MIDASALLAAAMARASTSTSADTTPSYDGGHYTEPDDTFTVDVGASPYSVILTNVMYATTFN